MIHIESGLYVRVQELDNGPLPRPLQSGFSEQNAYRVLGIYSASESAECFLILSNDRSELWFVSNRHFRVVGLRRSLTDTVVPLHEAIAANHPPSAPERAQPDPQATPEAGGPGRPHPPSSLHFNHGSSSYA